MRRRPSSRLLVIDQSDRVLLFRFVFKNGALAGRDYWVTPGGTLEANETFEEAARRELFEETGIVVDTVGEAVAEQEFVMQMPSGGRVIAEERFFLIRATGHELSRDQWTSLEKEVMTESRWWLVTELALATTQIFPENLVEILATVGIGNRE
jgi:8-oxo-dGTP diphosphatase